MGRWMLTLCDHSIREAVFNMNMSLLFPMIKRCDIYIFHACIISIKFLTRNTDVVCYKNKCIILIFNAIESFVYPSLLQYVSVHVCILYVLLLYLVFNCIYPSTKIDNGQTPKTGKCVVATFIKWNEMTILWNVHNHPEWYKRSQNAYDKTLFLCADVSNSFFIVCNVLW